MYAEVKSTVFDGVVWVGVEGLVLTVAVVGVAGADDDVDGMISPIKHVAWESCPEIRILFRSIAA